MSKRDAGSPVLISCLGPPSMTSCDGRVVVSQEEVHCCCLHAPASRQYTTGASGEHTAGYNSSQVAWGAAGAGDCLVAGYDPPQSVVVLLDSELGAEGGDRERSATPLVRPPHAYKLAWRDEADRPDRALALWRAQPPPGCGARALPTCCSLHHGISKETLETLGSRNSKSRRDWMDGDDCKSLAIWACLAAGLDVQLLNRGWQTAQESLCCCCAHAQSCRWWGKACLPTCCWCADVWCADLRHTSACDVHVS